MAGRWLLRQCATFHAAPPRGTQERAWIAPASGKRTDSGCAGARELPFAVGYPPEEDEHCPLDQLRNFFGGSGD